MSFSMSAVKIQQLHALVALPRPYNRLARVSGHKTAPVSRTHGCPRRRKVPTRNRSLSTTCRPWSVCARARTFRSRGELEVQIIAARVRSVPLRTSREVVTRVHAPNTARARVIRGVDVLVNTAGHRRVAKSSPSGRDHVLDIVCGSMNNAGPFVFALCAVAYDPNAEIECGNGRGIVLGRVAIHDCATDAVCCIFSARKHDLRRATCPPLSVRCIAVQHHSCAARELM